MNEYKFSEEYKSRPKWVEKLAVPPGWIKEKTDKELVELKYLDDRKKIVGNRNKIHSKAFVTSTVTQKIKYVFFSVFTGRPRSLRLALATEEQKEQVKELLEIQKKEKEAILQGFQLKDKEMTTCKVYTISYKC